MSDRIRVRTVLSLTPDARLALEALSIEMGCSMVQSIERLLRLPHRQLVALADQGQTLERET